MDRPILTNVFSARFGCSSTSQILGHDFDAKKARPPESRDTERRTQSFSLCFAHHPLTRNNIVVYWHRSQKSQSLLFLNHQIVPAMCLSNKTQQNNGMLDGNGCSSASDWISATFRQNKAQICDRQYFLSSNESRKSLIESSVVEPIRTAPQTVEPTPILAQKGAVQAVPSVETLPGNLKQYCEEYIAALSHLFPDEDSSWKQAYQHQQEAEPETPQESFSKIAPCFFDTPPDVSVHAATTITSNNHACHSTIASEPGKQIYPYQQERWMERYQDLVAFCHRHGHCNVPYMCNDNPCLGQWVKRQRHQYKLSKQGLHSNIDESRIQALNMLGFIWDSHGAAWEEKFEELKDFFQLHGNADVPCIYQGGGSSQLSTWIKRQRRQYRLFIAGESSTMDRVRISRLEDIGFVWDYFGNTV
jgi:hypothetical protein